MIVLDTTDKLEVVLHKPVTANTLDYFATWRDISAPAAPPSYDAGRSLEVSNNTTDVILVPAPAASTRRLVDLVNIHNRDTEAALVTVKLNANGTECILWRNYVSPDQTLTFVEGAGWSVAGGYRPVMTYVVHADAGANFAMTNATQAEQFAGNSSRHVFLVDLEGYTQVRLIAVKVVGSASVNTPRFRAKYYTSYSTTVGNFLQLGESSQVECSMVSTGYYDSGWVTMATGARINGCCIGFTELGGDGVADPALGFTSISFR